MGEQHQHSALYGAINTMVEKDWIKPLTGPVAARKKTKNARRKNCKGP